MAWGDAFGACGEGMEGQGYEVFDAGNSGTVESVKQPLGTWTAVTHLGGATSTISARAWDRSEGLAVVDNQPQFFDFSATFPTINNIPGTDLAGSGARIDAAVRQVTHPLMPATSFRQLDAFTRIKSKGYGYVMMQEVASPIEIGGFAWWPSWYAPFGTGNGILGSPSVSSTGSLEGDLDVYVTGTDSALYINSYIHTGAVTDPYSAPGHADSWGQVRGYWTGFSPLGGVISSGTSPAAASYRYGVVALPERDVLVRNTSGSLSWRYWKSGFGWSGWQNIFPANTFVGSPVAVRSTFAANSIDVFVLGTDNNIYRNRLTVTNPDFIAPRAYTWSGYVFCGKPAGYTLIADNIGATGAGLVVRTSSGNVFRASGDCP